MHCRQEHLLRARQTQGAPQKSTLDYLWDVCTEENILLSTLGRDRKSPVERGQRTQHSAAAVLRDCVCEPPAGQRAPRARAAPGAARAPVEDPPLPLRPHGANPVSVPFPPLCSGTVGPAFQGSGLITAVHTQLLHLAFCCCHYFFPSDAMQLPALCLFVEQTHPHPHPANEAIRGISR